MKHLKPLVAGASVSVLLCLVYVILGGGRYEPAAVADPCLERSAPTGEGTAVAVEGLILTALDGAACELGASREDVVLALRSRTSFENLATKANRTPDETAAVVKAQLDKALAETETSGALSGFAVGLVRGLTSRVPPWLLLDVLDRLGGLLS